MDVRVGACPPCPVYLSSNIDRVYPHVLVFVLFVIRRVRSGEVMDVGGDSCDGESARERQIYTGIGSQGVGRESYRKHPCSSTLTMMSNRLSMKDDTSARLLKRHASVS